MKAYSPSTLAYLSRRAGSVVRVLAHVWARDRATGAIVPMGLWNGEDDRVFIIAGQARTYFRASGVLQVDEIVSQPGTDVQYTTLRLCSIDEPVIALMRGYDPRFAPIEIHRALFYPDTGGLVDTPERRFRGWIDSAPIPVPEAGGDATMEVKLASANRALTQTLAFKKSDAALSQARSGDRFRRHTDVAGNVSVVWGEARL